jgi:hypothetical protein
MAIGRPGDAWHDAGMSNQLELRPVGEKDLPLSQRQATS